MTRGLIIANSHAAMVIAADRARADAGAPRPALDYLTEPGDGPDGVEIAEGRITATAPALRAFLAKAGAAEVYELEAYDFVLILGCGLSYYQAMPLLRNTAVWGWPSALDGSRRRSKPEVQLISEACYAEGLRARLEGTLAARLFHRLAAERAPILIAPQPRPSPKLMDPSAAKSMFRRATRQGDGAKIVAAFDAALDQVFKGAAILRQPEATVDRDLFTDQRFMDGATRLSAPGQAFEAEDVLHANASYGELVLQQIEQILS